jgi:murein DD-endopeptidase MepM/ murein hydrolase activator NlpD
MAIPRYTIVIVPSSRVGLRKFYISIRCFLYVLFGLALIAVLSIGTTLNHVKVYNAQSFTELQQENQALKNRLQKSEMLTNQLNRKITVLTRVTARLKIMAGFPDVASKRIGFRPGIGGATTGSMLDPHALMRLRQRAEFLERNLATLHDYFSDPKNQPLTPSFFPTMGFISSPFGMRKNPFTDEPDFHQGVDISGDQGTPITATAKGVISHAGIKGSLGLTVEVQHEQEIRTLFGHLQRITVQPGQLVKKGQIIGYMGNTGKSTGPHLHYEVHVKNQPVNPRSYLF